MTTRLLFLVMALFLLSCDFQQRAAGLVLDKDSKQPIAGVSVKKGFNTSFPEDKYLKYHSDQLGIFQVRYQTVALLGRPKLDLSFSKSGFKTSQATFAGYTQKDTVYLEKITK